jgi:hypothetical protein
LRGPATTFTEQRYFGICDAASNPDVNRTLQFRTR